MSGGRPAMTMGEIRAAMRDQDGKAHWTYGLCWCEAVHGPEAAGLRLVPPPWDEARGAAA